MVKREWMADAPDLDGCPVWQEPAAPVPVEQDPTPSPNVAKGGSLPASLRKNLLGSRQNWTRLRVTMNFYFYYFNIAGRA